MQFNTEMKLLHKFVGEIKQDLVMDRSYFQFQAVADLICKNREYSKNYEKLLKIMKKVKDAYYSAKIDRLVLAEL